MSDKIFIMTRERANHMVSPLIYDVGIYDINSVLQSDRTCKYLYGIFRHSFSSLNKFWDVIRKSQYIAINSDFCFIEKELCSFRGFLCISGGSLYHYEFNHVCVHPDYRKQGVATNLVCGSVKELFERNEFVKYITLVAKPELRKLYVDKCYFKEIED